MQQETDIVIIGAGGKIARACIQLFRRETDWRMKLASSQAADSMSAPPTTVAYHQIAATDYGSVREFCLLHQPRVIINAAAMTNVDACETERQLAHNLNVKVVENLVRICKITESHLIHYSTDYIFNGLKGPYLEDDKPDPINYYGKTKLAAENVILTSSISSTVIRTNIVYGRLPGVKTDFVTWVRDKCKNLEKITIANDQYGNPTLCDDVALATMRIIEKARTGVYHVAGADYCDRYDFARRIARYFDVSDDNIVPVSTSDLQLAARRPLKAGLITLKSETDLGLKPTGLDDGLLVYGPSHVNHRPLPKTQI